LILKKIFRIVLYLLLPLSASGQLTPVSDHYILNPLTINPACAGSRGALSIAAFYRRQWVGMPGAPETMTFSADAPLFDAKLGLGIIIVNDKIGVTKSTSYNSIYSYKINIGYGAISFGLGAGVIATNTNWSRLVLLDPGDEFALTGSRVYIVPDFSFGLYYNNRKYFAGISIPQLTGYYFDMNKNRYLLKVNTGQYMYLFHTGYEFEIASKTKFFPSALLSYSPQSKLQYDINTHFSFFNRFWIGASYHSTGSVTGLFQLSVNNQLKVAYSYYFDFSKLRKYNSGSHEIMLRYEFRYKVDAISPLNF
jgi:type IX secretion system PorP/SprF family membrane protein